MFDRPPYGLFTFVMFIIFFSYMFGVNMIIGSNDFTEYKTESFVPPSESKQNLDVILIAWSGVNHDVLKAMLAEGKLPALAELTNRGTLLFETEENDIPSSSNFTPAWSQILTGYNPAALSIFSNTHYRPIPETITIFERLEVFFNRFSGNIKTVFLAENKHYLHAKGEHELCVSCIHEYNITADNKSFGIGMKEFNEGILPWYNITPDPDIITKGEDLVLVRSGGILNQTKDNIDLFKNDFVSRENFTASALLSLESHNSSRYFMIFQLWGAHEIGHELSIHASEYNNSIIQNDLFLRKVLRSLEMQSRQKQTAVIVISDFGFNDEGYFHGASPEIFLATNLRGLKGPVSKENIAPTILALYGADPRWYQPPLPGKPLQKQNLMERAFEDAILGKAYS